MIVSIRVAAILRRNVAGGAAAFRMGDEIGRGPFKGRVMGTGRRIGPTEHLLKVCERLEPERKKA